MRRARRTLHSGGTPTFVSISPLSAWVRSLARAAPLRYRTERPRVMWTSVDPTFRDRYIEPALRKVNNGGGDGEESSDLARRRPDVRPSVRAPRGVRGELARRTEVGIARR